MHFLLCDFFSELLVLLFGDGFMVYALKEVLDIFKAVLAGVVGVEVGVEARDGCLGVKLSFVLGLGDAAIRILRLSDDLCDSVLPRRRTGEFIFDFCSFELSFVSCELDFIGSSVVVDVVQCILELGNVGFSHWVV